MIFLAFGKNLLVLGRVMTVGSADMDPFPSEPRCVFDLRRISLVRLVIAATLFGLGSHSQDLPEEK